MTSIADETTQQSARKAYESIEPFHVLAYFNPGLRAAREDLGIDAHAFYVGARGAPLGDCDPSVVVSAFYNFSSSVITPGWEAARSAGLQRVAGRRVQMLDDELRAILGKRVNDPEIVELTARYTDIAASLPFGGRPLASAWASAAQPEQPHVALWHAIAVLREWRGDNHIAVLVNHGLDALDAVTFHEAEIADPTVRRRLLGRKLVQITRGWSDDDWEASVDRLVDKGYAARTETGHELTETGLVMYRAIEAETDAITAPAWSGPDVDDLLDRTRPYVKAVIDAGVLPGTKKKD